MLLAVTLLTSGFSSRYLILRHGQTDHNALGIIQGSSDTSRLTQLGSEQAREAGATIAQLTDLLPIDRVFVSPNTRAQQTLTELRRALPDLPDVTVVDELREIDLGSWEGRNKSELKAEQPQVYDAWQRDPLGFALDDGAMRPVIDLWERAAVAWGTLHGDAEATRPRDDGAAPVTLIVSHNACGQALLCTALGLDASHFRRFEFANCAAVEVEFGAGGDEDAPPRWRWRVGPRAPSPDAADPPCFYIADDILMQRG